MRGGIRANFGLDVLVVSHACIVPSNQEVFRCLRERGTLLKLVVPDRWSDAYRHEGFRPNALGRMEDAMMPLPTVGAGRAQRHAYIRNPMRILRRLRPKLVVIEEEPYSLAALQWGAAATMLGVGFGVQAAETIDRSFPSPVLRGRRYVLRRAAFVMARSPGAQTLALEWGARGEVALVPHAIPSWHEPRERRLSGQFTVGYAGRLVAEKGLDDLLAAVAAMETSARLLLVGDGPMREQLHRTRAMGRCRGRPATRRDGPIVRRDGRACPALAHHCDMGRAVRESAGRSSLVRYTHRRSGERSDSMGGRHDRWWSHVPRGGCTRLSKILDELAIDPLQRRTMVARGRKVVQETFSTEAVATTLAGVLSRAETLRH